MPEKPFFRKHDGWWYVQLRQGNKRFQKKLVKGKDNEREAYRLFNELMAREPDALPPPARLKVTDVLRAFLEHAARTTSERTFAFYQSFLANFDDLYGSLRPSQVSHAIVDAWLNSNKGWRGCRRAAVIALKRAFNWASENGVLATSPVKGYKKPPARARERYLTPEERRRIFDSYPEGDCFRDFLFAMEQSGCRP